MCLSGPKTPGVPKPAAVPSPFGQDTLDADRRTRKQRANATGLAASILTTPAERAEPVSLAKQILTGSLR